MPADHRSRNKDTKTYHQDRQAEVFETRWNHIVKTCMEEGRTPPNDLEHSKLSPKMLLELPHNILYCPVEKVASTFWKKTLTAMNSNGVYKSPFQVRGKRYRAKSYIHHLQYTNNLDMGTFRKHATSLLVVRDPYSKVFSAYVDKLFHPNAIFWEHIGIPIEKTIANKGDSNHTLCGHTVKFADYVKYLIYKHERQEHLNSHFTSIVSHCDPCQTKYDFISKLETFKDDYQAIIAQWNKSYKVDIGIKDFDRNSAIDIARVHINLALYTKQETQELCGIPDDSFITRMWRFLQISGIIPKQAEVPANWYLESFQQKTEYLLVDVLKVINRFYNGDYLSPSEHPQINISWSEVKKQRKEAMLQAYRTVDIHDLHKLREIVKLDCKYFGYDDMPTEIFNRSSYTSLQYSQYFDYFDTVK